MQNHHFCEDLKYKQMSATFGYTRHSVRDFKQMTPTQVDRHNSSGSNLQLNNSSIIPPTATSRISATNMQTMNSESSPRGSPNSSVSFGTTSSSNPSLINGYNSLNCSLTSSTDSYVNCSSSSAISNVSCCNGDAGNANIDAVSESFNKVLSLASLSPNQSASLTDQPQRRSIVINNDQLIHSPIWMPNTNFNNDNINNNYTKNNNNTNHQPTLTTSVTYSSLQTKALKCFESRSAYVEAMKEDLAEWLNRLYPDLDLTTGNFFSRLETGSIMCRHANYVTNMGRKASKDAKLNDDPAVINKTLSLSTPTNKRHVIDWLKVRILSFKPDAKAGTFFARDNICQFIHWCRSLKILDCLLFETDDLVARKNERSFILCMLEVARIGYAVGVSTPLIIQLEQEIDREIENEAKQEEEEKEKQQQQQQQQQINQDLQEATISNQTVNDIDDNDEKRNFVQFHDNENAEVDYEYASKPQVITNDLMSLHEKVVQLLCQCTCPTQFPMVRVGDNGKYKVGDKLIIFVRILRRHIMVRVGGGWQELSEFLRAKDPCRMRPTNQQQCSSSINNNNNQHYTQTSCQQQSLEWPTNASQHHNHHNNNQFNKDSQRLSNGSPSSGLMTIVNNHTISDNNNKVLRNQHRNSTNSNNNNNTHSEYNYHPTRSMSGSASMNWLSHNSRC